MVTKQIKCDCCNLRDKHVRPVAGHILCDKCHLNLHRFSHLILHKKGVKMILETKINKSE